MTDMQAILGLAIFLVLVVGIIIATAPTCKPDEVYARGFITPLICVQGHR